MNFRELHFLFVKVAVTQDAHGNRTDHCGTHQRQGTQNPIETTTRHVSWRPNVHSEGRAACGASLSTVWLDANRRVTDNGLTLPKLLARLGMPRKIAIARRPNYLVKRKLVASIVPTSKSDVFAIPRHWDLNKATRVPDEQFITGRFEIKALALRKAFNSVRKDLVSDL